jgi:hypothetical protein
MIEESNERMKRMQETMKRNHDAMMDGVRRQAASTFER